MSTKFCSRYDEIRGILYRMAENTYFNRWLTLDEAQTLLRCDFRHLKQMIKKGALVAIEVNAPHQFQGRRGYGNRKLNLQGKDGWRVLFPGDRFVKYMIDQTKRLETTPMLSAREAAALLDITPLNLRQRTFQKEIVVTIIDKRAYYSVTAIRDYMVRRSDKYAGSVRLKGLGKKQLLAWMIEWGKDIIKEKRPDLGEVLDQILSLPEPQRSLRIESLVTAAENFRALLRMPLEVPGLLPVADSSETPEVPAPETKSES